MPNLDTHGIGAGGLANGIDGRHYKALRATATTTLTSILNVTGRGYLSTALLFSTHTHSHVASKIRITIDGTVILYLGANLLWANTGYCGIGYAESLESTNTVRVIPVTENGLSTSSISNMPDVAFPRATEQTITEFGKVILAKRPILFKNNLKVEVLGSASTTVVVEYYLK